MFAYEGFQEQAISANKPTPDSLSLVLPPVLLKLLPVKFLVLEENTCI